MEPPSAGCCEAFEEAYVRPKPGRTLIVGSRVYKGKPDRRKLYKDVLGIDMLAGPGADRVLNMEDRLPDDLGQFDHIECLSVLEHSRQPWKMAENIQSLLAPDGTLFVSVPFVWRCHAYPDDYWRMTPAALVSIFTRIEWEKLAFGYGATVAPITQRLPVLRRNGIPFFARTETLGFGRCP